MTFRVKEKTMSQKRKRKRLDGKVAIITGATGGIGEATARRFLEEGASVMLVGRSKEKLKATRGRLAGFETVADFVADAVDEAATRSSVEATVEAFGGVDIVVANAGIEGNFAPIENLTLAGFESVLRTNVIGVWLSMKYAVEPMKQRGGGSMIALSSIAGMNRISDDGSVYRQQTRGFRTGQNRRARTAEAGIRVNAIGPGPIDNRMMRSLESQLIPGDPAAAHDLIIIPCPDETLRHKRRSRQSRAFSGKRRISLLHRRNSYDRRRIYRRIN